MPFGAFRLNSLSRAVAATSGPTGNQYVNSSGISSAGGFSHDVTYLGDDSSSRPVFAYAWRDTSGNSYAGKIITFRLNSDLTTTIGSTYTLSTTEVGFISISSERDGSGFRAASGYTNYGYCHWWQQSTLTHKVVAFSYNLNAMTLSLGTVVDCGNDGGAQTTMTYIGNSQIVYAQGNGGWNGRQKIWTIVTRTTGTTTLTKTTNVQWIQTFNQGSNFNARGMTPGTFVSIEGSGWNGNGWDVNSVRNNAGTWVEYGIEGVAPGDYPYSTGYNQIAQLNNTNRFLSSSCGNFSATTGQGIKVMSHEVTWGTGATVPVWIVSPAMIITSNGNFRYGLCGGIVDNEGFFLQQDDLDSNKLKYRFLYSRNVSGSNYICQTPATTLSDITVSKSYGVMDALRFVTVGTTAYLISVLRDNATGELDFLAGKWANYSSRVIYEAYASTGTVYEGSSVTFSIYTTNVAAGTTLYYTIENVAGTLSTADFTDGLLSGSFTSGSPATITKTLANADGADANERFRLMVRTGSTTGPVVAESNDVRIREPITMAVSGWNTSLTTTIQIPAIAAVGDIAILSDYSATTTLTVPAGWTQLTSVTSTGLRTTISYKVLVAGDPGATITGMAGATRKIINVYRPSSTTGYTLSFSTPSAQATTLTPSNQTITGNTTTTSNLYFAAYAKNTATTPTRGWSGSTPTEYTAVSSGGIYVKELIINNSGPTTATISMTDAGTNSLQSFRMTLTLT